MKKFKKAFRKIQKKIHKQSNKSGFWPESLDYETEEYHSAAMLALIAGEGHEALEAYRANNPPSEKLPDRGEVEEELADIIIRTMDWAQAHGVDLAGVIEEKMEYNSTRKHKHGKRF